MTYSETWSMNAPRQALPSRNRRAPSRGLFFAWRFSLAHSGPFWALLLPTLPNLLPYTKSAYNRPSLRLTSSCKPSETTQPAPDRIRCARFNPPGMLSPALSLSRPGSVLVASWRVLAWPIGRPGPVLPGLAPNRPKIARKSAETPKNQGFSPGS